MSGAQDNGFHDQYGDKIISGYLHFSPNLFVTLLRQYTLIMWSISYSFTLFSHYWKQIMVFSILTFFCIFLCFKGWRSGFIRWVFEGDVFASGDWDAGQAIEWGVGAHRVNAPAADTGTGGGGHSATTVTGTGGGGGHRAHSATTDIGTGGSQSSQCNNRHRYGGGGVTELTVLQLKIA